MKTLGNILWHFPFFGFVSAILVYLLGLLLTATVIAAPVGLGLMEFGKFLFWPFGNAMVNKGELNIEQNKKWKVYSTIIMVIYFPFGILLCIGAIFQVVFLFFSIIGIPAALVVAKSLGTYLNPVNKKCVHSVVKDELDRRKAQQQINKHLGLTSTSDFTSNANKQTQDLQQFTQTEQPKTEIAEAVSKPISTFSNLTTQNKKGFIIVVGSILGLVLLFVLIKFLLRAEFKKDSFSNQQISKTQSNESTITQNKISTSSNNNSTLIENQFIIDTYIGTIGDKNFKLLVEKVEGETVEGYNITGSNKRPVKGHIVNKWKDGDYTTVFKLILNEPGDDKWDGVFKIDLYISDLGRSGKGSWKSFNGKLEHNIIINDRLNE